MTLGNSETSAAKRNKVYVIEWRHETERKWYPIVASTNFRESHAGRKERTGLYPLEKFRVRKYYAELEEVTDAKP